MLTVKHKILVVDDNEVNRLICSELLEDSYQVEHAVDGEQAIEKATEFNPDLVLLDVMMPGIDGLEVCRRLRKSSRPWVKIILVSAKVQTADRIAGYEAGADDYIGKPFTEDELLAKVRIHMKLKRTEEVDELKYNVLRAMQHGNRTPITKILCRSEMLVDRQNELSEESYRDAQLILKATRGLHQWLNSAHLLIQLKSQMAEIEEEVFEVESFLEKFIMHESRRDPRFEDQVELRLTSSHLFLGDIELLESMLKCVLLDSMGRVDDAGIITVAINSGLESQFQISIVYPSQPMSAAQIQAAFEPFGTPDEILFNRGDGMALAISQEIADLHNGIVRMTAEKGTTNIELTLPRHQMKPSGTQLSSH